MKAYLIDEITPPDMKKVIGFIEKNTIKSFGSRFQMFF